MKFATLLVIPSGIAFCFALFTCLSVPSPARASGRARIAEPVVQVLPTQPTAAPSTVDETVFNQVIDQTIGSYQGLAGLHGASILSKKDWALDDLMGALASQIGHTWEIEFYGGFARTLGMTSDAFTLTVCHELGHHFGGFPFYRPTATLAAEGEADYFAAFSCLRNLWKSQTAENSTYRKQVSATLQNKCDHAWSSVNDQDLCYRIITASQRLASSFYNSTSKFNPAPSVDRSDTTRVAETYVWHSSAQCRLDTFVNGALCRKSFDLTVIPGKPDDSGMTTGDPEQQANQYSCSSTSSDFQVGSRPFCWFKPEL